jgi:hypothetical protein
LGHRGTGRHAAGDRRAAVRRGHEGDGPRSREPRILASSSARFAAIRDRIE